VIYKALDEVVKLAECEIYVYNPNPNADPFLEEGAIWSFCFLFYNRKLKRVAGFRFSCTRLDDCHPTKLSFSLTVFFLKSTSNSKNVLLQ
jgi:hypothetical protein